MKKEWFEPGPDGKSPFEQLSKTKGFGAAGTAAAFRALLAGEDCGRTADAKDAEIAELRESLERSRLALNTTRQQRDQFWSQRDAARAEVERLKSECSDQQRYVLDLESAIARKETRIKVLEVANDSLTQYSSNLTAERDALQARIDARPIDQPDHIADPGKMVDERKGERRVIVPEYITEDGRDYSMDYPSPWRTNRRKSNRRRTAGTIADRKEAS